MSEVKDIIQENDKKLAELKEAASPLIKYLCENYHPHVTAIVTPTSIEVMEGVQAVSNITEFIVDKMAQQGIYVSPDNIVPNRDRGVKQNLYLYVCKYNIAYGNGMVLVAARNPIRAMEILEATNRKDDYGYSVYQDADLEHVVGATLNGYEGILHQQHYLE